MSKSATSNTVKLLVDNCVGGLHLHTTSSCKCGESLGLGKVRTH